MSDKMPARPLQSRAVGPTGLRAWRVELLFGLPIIGWVIFLFHRWFAVLDRYAIFLYHHRMGAGFDTTPFGWVTVGRYWMSGLVAGGAVMVPYIAVHLVLGRAVRSFRAPDWQRVWIVCAIPLLVAIPAIVMTVNAPVLPLRHALQITAATLIGLALPLVCGQMAAHRPLAYLLLMADGLALALLLIALVGTGHYRRWLTVGNAGAIYRHLVMVAAGVGLLVITTALHYWRRSGDLPSAVELFVAGLDVAYLVLPLYHHLFWSTDEGSWTDPGYFSYMPSADNYFARSALLQGGIWIAVALVAFGLTRLRWRLCQSSRGAGAVGQ